MDPLDYAFGQSMGLFSGALRIVPFVIRLALRILPLVLAVVLVVCMGTVASLGSFVWGCAGVIVVGFRRDCVNLRAQQLAQVARNEILTSALFVRCFGITRLRQTVHPGDDVYPRQQADPMALFIPAQWLRFMFSLVEKLARGFLDIGIFLGTLLGVVILPIRKECNK